MAEHAILINRDSQGARDLLAGVDFRHWKWYRETLFSAALLHVAAVLLGFEAYFQIRHPTLRVHGSQYMLVGLAAICAWLAYCEYAKAMREGGANAGADDDAVIEVAFVKKHLASVRSVASAQVLAFGLAMISASLLVSWHEMRVGSWPTVIATVRTVEFRAGGVRVVFDLEVNGHWYQAEVTRTGWEPSLRSSLEGYEPGKPQSVQYDPDDPTQATAAWSTWRATRADRFLTFLALLGLVSAIGAGRELSELSPTA